jgi:DNA polymerase-1
MSGLYLVDAMALAYRSFFALLRTNMRAPDGRPTSAVFGFAQALLRVVESRGPSHMAIARDLSGPTFRHRLYPAYKAQRQPMPDDLRVQIPLVEELAAACGLPMVSLAEYEADDVMATYARIAAEAKIPVYLMTRDKDLMALVGDGIRLFDPGRGTERPEEIDPVWVKAKFGVEPSQVRDYLALVGDASDNVPGVPKVGEKTAAELLSRYPDIESIYAHLEEIGQTKKAVRRNLEEGRDLMEISRTLVTLRDDLDLPPLKDLEFRGLDIPGVKRFLSDLGMRSLVSVADKLGGSSAPKPTHPDVSGLGLFESAPTDPSPVPAINLQVVSDEEDLAFLAGILRAVDSVSLFAVPVSSKDPIGIGLSWGEGIGRYLPIGEKEGQLAPSAVREALGDLWSDPGRTWIAFDGKSLRRSMERMGWRLGGVVEEVQIAAYLLAPGERHLELERIAHFRSGRVLRRWEDLLGSARARREPESVPPEEMCGWAAAAAEALVPAWKALQEGLEKQTLSKLYSEVERPLSEVLRRMEDHGIALDRGLFAHLSTEMTNQIAALEAKASEAAGVEFNVGSPKQLGEILFDRLGLKAGRKTETGQRSTDSDTLENLRDQHPLPGIVLEHRELAKLLGTYVDPLPLMADANGRVHTLFQQTVAATGRLSSVDPNLQNIPVRGEIGRQLRKGFVAGPGNVLVSADYSQIELRLLAHLSGDAALRAVYEAGEDIHARTASVVHGVEPKSVTADQRRAAKVVNFGVVYGMGPHALAAQTELSYADAKKFIEGYFAAYPGVKPYMEGILEGARANGYVETILGRKRWIREINEKNRVFKERAEREAVNTPIQGSAADLVKLAMLAVDREIRAGRLEAALLLQVHDELVLECPAGCSAEVAARVKELMEGAMTFPCRCRWKRASGRTGERRTSGRAGLS